MPLLSQPSPIPSTTEPRLAACALRAALLVLGVAATILAFAGLSVNDLLHLLSR